MATKLLQRFIIYSASTPLILLSRIAEVFNLWGIEKDLSDCLSTVDGFGNEIPHLFITVLVTAEDRRNALHFGVDPIAVIRAAYMSAKGYRQGASTIEQQFVRVVTKRYEKNIKRKLKEQILAVTVARHRSKDQIAAAYLSIAFYGSGILGVKGLKAKCGQLLSGANTADVIGMVARLKYPEPLVPSKSWAQKFTKRIQYIAARLECHR